MTDPVIRIERISTNLAVTWVNGQIFYENRFEIEESLDGLVNDPGITRLVIDLSEVTFLSSMFLGLLNRVSILMQRKGGSLGLVRPAVDDAYAVFTMTHLDKVLNFYPDWETAASTDVGRDD